MAYRLLILLSFVFSISFGQSDPWKNVYTQSGWAERDHWQRTDELIQLLKLKEGGVVADVGCHEGYMTFKLSKAVGHAGKVYAVDVEEERLEKLKKHAASQKVQNVVTVKGEYDNPKLPTGILDGIVIIDTYHEMDHHDEILRHLKNSLKKGGRLLICEPIADDRRNDSRSDQEKRHELGMRYALEDLIKAGFKIITQQDPFIDRERVKGDKMWLIVAEKQ